MFLYHLQLEISFNVHKLLLTCKEIDSALFSDQLKKNGT